MVDWLLDGSGGPVQSNVVVEVDGERIARIGPADAVAVAGDLYYARSTCIPLLMDAHVHLAFSGQADPILRRQQLTYDAAKVAEVAGRHLEDHWRCGIAAVRDAGDRQGAVRRAVNNRRPQLVTARTTSCAWHANGRYGAQLGRAVPDAVDLSQAVETCLAESDHVKIIQSGINSLDRFGHSGLPQFAARQLAEAVGLAHAQDKPVMVHANGEAAVQSAVEAGCESIEHGYFMGRDNLRRMRDRDCIWVPTLVPIAVLAGLEELTPGQREVARRTMEHQLEQVAFARTIGVKIALGTDAGSVGVLHGEAVQKELVLLVEAGLSISEAVQCGAEVNARLLQLAHRGIIAADRRADFMIVSGSPDDFLQKGLAPAALWLAGRCCGCAGGAAP